MARRPLRRPVRRPLRGRPLRSAGRRSVPVAPRVQKALGEAHRAMESGDTTRAAEIFLELARAAARRGMPARAAGLTLEAACAVALSGEAAAAVDHAHRALTFFSGKPLPERVAATVERLVKTLREGGHEAEAAKVEEMLEGVLQAAGTSRQEMAARFAAARSERRGKLPGKCASCAGPIMPDEVEWHGSDAAECPYCGSVVTVE